MTFIYPAVFHQREDGKYEGRFVDLAMCYGVGDTLDEAIREMLETNGISPKSPISTISN